MGVLHAGIDTVAMIMSATPVTVRPETTVDAAVDTLESAGIAACPVTDSQGELQGMVSRVDLLRAFRPSRELRVLEPGQISRLPVREVMHCGVVTVEPSDPLVTAVDRFVETRLHALPVVDRRSGRPILVGIVTQGDALRHLMRGAAARAAAGQRS